MADTENERLARDIRTARVYGEMSRQQVATALGVSAGTVGRYERGHFVRPPRGPALEALARAAGIPPAWLADGFLAPIDPARRFGDAARREAQRRDERPGSARAPRDDEGDQEAAG